MGKKTSRVVLNTSLPWQDRVRVLLYACSSCPAFSQFDWLVIAHPARWMQLPNKIDDACLTKLSQILGKLRKVIKLGKSNKLVSDFLEISVSFWKFEKQQKTLENDFGLIREKYFFGELSANCRSMFGIFSFLAYNELFINRIARAVP